MASPRTSKTATSKVSPRSSASPDRESAAKPRSSAARSAAPNARSAAPNAPKAGRRGAAGADQGTRRKLIDAAIQTILDQGFYRASSNAIAETAGLSWGVIQYYFGSREALMLAVHEEGTLRLMEELRRADITGDTIEERLEQYFNILEGYYGSPAYLAFVQVMLNLSHDPRTSEQARDTIAASTQAIHDELERLTHRLLDGTAVADGHLRQFPFHVLRGLALSESMLRALPTHDPSSDADETANRRLLARALALLLDAGD